MGRLEGKVAIVVGAGQSPGEEIGNGRATTVRFLQEGARVVAADLDVGSAGASVEMAGGGVEGVAAFADAARTETLRDVVALAMERWGRVDVLHYNVGVSIMGGPQALDDLTDETFDRITSINLRGAIMAAKAVAPIMRDQRSGAATFVSSITAVETFTPLVAYRTSKAGMVAFMQQFAAHNAPFGVRANAILPGLMQTSMAVDTRMRVTGRSREEIVADRNARVPLAGRAGTGWDVANAALFLASDEAAFVTGAVLPVDGGTLVRIGW